LKRALITASVASMIDQFLMANIHMLSDMGYEVHVACNFEEGSTCSSERITELKKRLTEDGIRFFQIDFARNVIRITEHFSAYEQIKKLIRENRYDLIHCHSPIGGLLTRLACRKFRKTGTRVFYTAHGFHFYKGASLKNWLLYYPVEKFCSRFTDVLITINKEDFGLAQKKMHAARVEYVPGVGIDVQRFSSTEADRAQYRRELGIPEDAVLLLSVGELNENKNHQTVINAIADLDVYYIIAGKGGSEEALRNTVSKLHLEERVKLLGYRKDIDALCAVSDIFVFPSFREGLPVSVMEAMASGLPVVCSRIRGNTDLIDENGGIFFDPHDADDCRKAITQMLASDMQKYGAINRERAKAYSVDTINTQMKQIIENAL